MHGLLNYRDEPVGGFDPIDCLAELFFDVGLEIILELLAALLEAL